MPDINQTAIRVLAWQICSDDKRAPVQVSSDTRAALQSAINDGSLVEDEHGVRFADERAMVVGATEYFLAVESDQLLTSPRSCFERLDQVSVLEIGKEHRVSGFALAELHNIGRVDGFVWGKQAIEAGVDVFDVLHVMEGAISFFATAQAQSICDFFIGHYGQVKTDLLGGLLYAKLPSWLATMPGTAHALCQIHESSPKESSASVYGCALHSLIIHSFEEGFPLAFKSAQSQTAMISGPALHILGLVDYANLTHFEVLEQVIELCAGIIRIPGHPQLGIVTRTLGCLLSRSETRIAKLLHEAVSTEDPAALYALSESLFRRESEFREREWFWPLYLRLAATKAEHKGVVKNIDMALMGWVRHPKTQDRVLEFLNAWIGCQPIEVIQDKALEKLFGSTLHHIEESFVLLVRTVTAWLCHDDVRYAMVGSQVISHLHKPYLKPMTLDLASLDALRTDEIVFLVRRILGFIIDCDMQINLIFSLVRTRDAKTRTLGLVKEVLLEHVGYDYPYQTVDFLKLHQDSEPDEDIKAMCGEVMVQLKSGLDRSNSLPWLKELLPLSAKTHRFVRERGKQMNKAIDDVSKDSIWRQLTSHVILKAGRRTFQSMQGRYTQPMELKSLSHSITIPFSEISDPAGAALKRILFRTATKDTN